MQAFVFTARPDIIIQFWINQRHQIVIKQAMDYSVTHACDSNVPTLLFIHYPVIVFPVLVSTTIHISTKL